MTEINTPMEGVTLDGTQWAARRLSDGSILPCSSQASAEQIVEYELTRGKHAIPVEVVSRVVYATDWKVEEPWPRYQGDPRDLSH